jgi:hypothetical protein
LREPPRHDGTDFGVLEISFSDPFTDNFVLGGNACQGLALPLRLSQ